jgi:hypothetical protein
MPTVRSFRVALRLAAIALASAASAQAQTIERVRLTDGELTCAQIHPEIGNMDAVSKAMPQVSGQALARKEFLTQLFVARGCRVSALSFAGTPVSPDTFRRLMARRRSQVRRWRKSRALHLQAPASAADIQAALAAPVTVLDAGNHVKGTAALKGKRYYVSEYRVMVETGGSITASTRAAYLGGAVYDATLEASKPGAPVTDEADLGYGKRRYLVFAPTGMKLNSRGFAGLGAGNISQRITYSKANLEAISVVLAINIAAQESSGSGSSLFRRGSSANASAAMEAGGAPRMLLLQSHAQTQALNASGALQVPGQFATMRESGGYDTRNDAAMQGIQALGRMMGQAGNQSKRVEMMLDVDTAAMSRMALQGMMSMNQGIAGAIR